MHRPGSELAISRSIRTIRATTTPIPVKINGSTMTATNHDDHLGEIYPTMMSLTVYFGVSFSRFHCCGCHNRGSLPPWCTVERENNIQVYARREMASDLVGDDGRIQLHVRVTDSGTPPLTSTVVFVVRLNVTLPRPLVVNDRPTSTNLALPLVLVAGAAVLVMAVCFLAARRIGPLGRSSEATYMAAPGAYFTESSIDDVTCAADCSTEVALGSTLRLQVLLRDLNAQYTPPTPTRLNCRVESRRRCVHNPQLVGDSRDESEQICQRRSRVVSCRRCEHTRQQS